MISESLYIETVGQFDHPETLMLLMSTIKVKFLWDSAIIPQQHLSCFCFAKIRVLWLIFA